MPELIEVESHGFPSPECWFAIAAICDTKTARKVEVPNRDDGCIEATLIINGVEVSFVETVRELYRRLDSGVGERAATLAYDAAKLKGLNGLKDAIEKADWHIRNKIEETFGVTLSED